mgnify:CR=1 FL=1
MKKKSLFFFSLFILCNSYGQLIIDPDIINGESAFDLSGKSVSLSNDGSVIAIGAYLNGGNGDRSGQVRIYKKTNGTWAQVGSDIDGEAVDDQSGISVSLSGDGRIVAIGAIGNNGNDSVSGDLSVCDGGYDVDFGQVRIYENTNGTWAQIGSDIDGEAADDRSGISVSLSDDGSIVAIGAAHNDGNGVDSGQVRIYKNTNNNWVQVGSDIDGEAPGDGFGQAVSLSDDGTIVAIGAASNDGNGANSGQVRIYKNTDDTWVQVGSDIDGEAAGDRSGISVSLSGDGSIVAIGAASNDGNGMGSGHVRIYKNTDGTWVQVGLDIDGEAAGAGLGYAVSLSNDGTIVAIGAASTDDMDSRKVRVYKNIYDIWVQVGLYIDSNVSGGISIAGYGEVVAIGDIGNDDNGMDSGEVRIYELIILQTGALQPITKIVVCEGGSTTLTAPEGTDYLWNTGETTASITVSPMLTTDYTVVVSNDIGLSAFTFDVDVLPIPIADAGSDVIIDEGDSTTLTGSGGDTYLWSTGETTASITVGPTSTTTYTVTAFSNGCSSDDDVSVTVNLECSYSIINSEGFETGWGIWNDGGSDCSRNSNTTYASTGKYSMRLRDDTSTSVGTTDNLNLTAYEEISIDFSYYCKHLGKGEGFWLQISTDGGEKFTTVEEWYKEDEFLNLQQYNEQVVIPGPFTANTQFRFRADGSNNDDMVYLDDIVISGCSKPSCIINSEGFETGWGIWNDGGSDCSRNSNTTYASTGKYSMRLRDDTSTSVGTTDNLDLATYEEISIDFSYYCKHLGKGEGFWLQISTDGGQKFTTVEEWYKEDEFLNSQRYNGHVTIPGPFTANTQFRFRADGSNNDDTVYLDDIAMSGCSKKPVTKPAKPSCTIDSESFETGWGIWNDGGSDCTRNAKAAYSNTGEYNMRLRDGTSTSMGTTDNLDLTAYEEISIDFSYYCRHLGKGEGFWLQISTDGGEKFTTVEEWYKEDEFLNLQRYNEQVIIPGPFTTNTQFRFRADGSNDDDVVHLDDIVISGCGNSSSSSSSSKLIETNKSSSNSDSPYKVTETNNTGNSPNSSSKLAESDTNVPIDSEDAVISKKVTSVIYPNPFESQFNIRIEEGFEKTEVEILNVLGQLVYGKIFYNNETIEIPTLNFPKGLYLVRMKIDDQTLIVKKAIKK